MNGENRLRAGKDIPVTSLFMILFGLFALLYGCLLFPIVYGLIPYSGDGARALFLIVFAIMITLLGVTPVGTFRHSWPLFLVGLALTLLGALSYMSPGLFEKAASTALGIILLVMGFVRLPFFLVRKSREFAALPSLYLVCFYLMHILCVVLGLIIILPEAFPRVISATALIALGVVQLILGFSALRIEADHPGTTPAATRLNDIDEKKESSITISLDDMIMLLLATVLFVMAIMAFLGAMGFVEFEDGGVYALFLFITAMQVMLVGNTPVKTFDPSWPLVILGMALACLAMAATIVPGLLNSALGILVGILNLATAVFGFVRSINILVKTAGHRPSIATNMIATGIVLYILLFVFAVNILLPGTIPGMALLVTLIVTGAMMIRLVLLKRKADKASAGDGVA